MALERERFCALLEHPKTQERIMGMLQTGQAGAQLSVGLLRRSFIAPHPQRARRKSMPDLCGAGAPHAARSPRLAPAARRGRMGVKPRSARRSG